MLLRRAAGSSPHLGASILDPVKVRLAAEEQRLATDGGWYGTAGQGTRFYTLDAITGDVVAAPDVTPAAATAGLTRSAAQVTYVQADGSTLVLPNTIVANAVAYVPDRFNPLQPPPPAGAKATRAYVGDTQTVCAQPCSTIR